MNIMTSYINIYNKLFILLTIHSLTIKKKKKLFEK